MRESFGKYIQIIVIAALAILLIVEKVGRSADNKRNARLIETVQSNHEETKKLIDVRVDSLRSAIGKNLTVAEQVKKGGDKILKEIKEIQDERNKVNDDIPNYPERKLDSIITNYRHQ
jgi:flagellar hook assembly protein FlgD